MPRDLPFPQFSQVNAQAQKDPAITAPGRLQGNNDLLRVEYTVPGWARS